MTNTETWNLALTLPRSDNLGVASARFHDLGVVPVAFQKL